MSVDLSNLSTSAPQAIGKEAPAGTSATGEITFAERRQVTDFQTGKPETWDDGNPKEQLKLIIDTGQPDPENDGTTERAVYIKLWGAQKAALIEALKTAGVKQIDTGGRFTITFTGEGEAPRAGFSKPKIYTYQYQAPTQSVSLGDQVNTTTGEVTSGQAQQNVEQQLGGQPAAQPTASNGGGGGVDTEQIKTLINAGLQDPQIAGATGADLAVITAIRNTL